MAALGEQLSPNPICRVAGLTFAYPGREDEPVLRDVSLSVAAGAFCVIVGPTGCGKDDPPALPQARACAGRRAAWDG